MKRRIDPRKIEAVDPAVAAILRSMQPYERVALTAQAFEIVRELLVDLVQAEYQDWTEDELHREVGRRIASGAHSFSVSLGLLNGSLVLVARERESPAQSDSAIQGTVVRIVSPVGLVACKTLPNSPARRVENMLQPVGQPLQ